MADNQAFKVLDEKKTNFANFLEGLNKKINNANLEHKISLMRSVDVGSFITAMNANVSHLIDKDPKVICDEYNIPYSQLEPQEIDKVIRYVKLFTGNL